MVSLSGDGGFAMLMGDLLTLRQQKLPLKIVVYNNGTLGFVELEMKAAGYIETGVALDNPDFAAMARGAGIHAVRVEDPAELEAAVREVLAHPGPALLDCVVARQELSMPPEDRRQAGQGLQPLRPAGGDERARGFGPRPRQDEPAPLDRTAG